MIAGSCSRSTWLIGGVACYSGPMRRLEGRGAEPGPRESSSHLERSSRTLISNAPCGGPAPRLWTRRRPRIEAVADEVLGVGRDEQHCWLRPARARWSAGARPTRREPGGPPAREPTGFFLETVSASPSRRSMSTAAWLTTILPESFDALMSASSPCHSNSTPYFFLSPACSFSSRRWASSLPR